MNRRLAAKCRARSEVWIATLLATVLFAANAAGQRPAATKNAPVELPDRVANAKGPGEIHRFADHPSGVNCVAVSQDGRQLATASDDKTVFIYDLKSLKALHRLEDNDAPISGVGFTPNGKDIVTAGGRGEPEDRNIRFWDRQHGQLHMRVIGRNSQTTSLAIAPDGMSMMTTYRDRFSDLRFFDAPGDTLALAVHRQRCWDAAFSRDSKFVVTVGGEGECFVWNNTRPPKSASRMMMQEIDVRAVAFSPSGEFILTGGSDRIVRL
jgi:WD40 repeat protein